MDFCIYWLPYSLISASCNLRSKIWEDGLAMGRVNIKGVNELQATNAPAR
jgi:hypothetical protein